MTVEPIVYEWIIWDKNGDVYPQFNPDGTETSFGHVTSQIKEFWMAGWIPLSPDRAYAVNSNRENPNYESRAVSAHFVELEPDEVPFLRRRHAIETTQPIIDKEGNFIPPQHLGTKYYYIIGSERQSTYIAIDSMGNTRQGANPNIKVPVIPQADREIPEIAEMVKERNYQMLLKQAKEEEQRVLAQQREEERIKKEMMINGN